MNGHRNQGFVDGLMRGYQFVSDLQQRDRDNAMRQQEYGLRLKADDRQETLFNQQVSDYNYGLKGRLTDEELAEKKSTEKQKGLLGNQYLEAQIAAEGRKGMKQPEGAPFEAMRDGNSVFVQRYSDGSYAPVDGYTPPPSKNGLQGQPYYIPVSTSSGIVGFNARSGEYAPLVGESGPLMPPAIDPNAQGAVAAAKEVGKGRGEAAAAREKSTAQANPTIDTLNEALKLLPKSTGSTLGRARDRAAAAVGASTEGGEAAEQLKILAAKLVMNVPRFEGPQSDKDTQQYRDAAGNLADTSLPVASRMASARLMMRLAQKASRQTPNQGYVPAAPSAAPAAGTRKVIRSGTVNGKRVVQYEDGTIEEAQ